MALKKPIPRLLCYDIADPRRLSRVHRIVLQYAIPVQYSVYYLYVDAETVETLCAELREVIHSSEDDIRIYPLHEGGRMESLGRQGFPEGVQIEGISLPEGFGHGMMEQKNDTSPEE